MGMRIDRLKIFFEKALDERYGIVTMNYELFGVSSSLTTVSDDTAGCARSVAWTNHPGDGTAFKSSSPIIGAVLDSFFGCHAR